MPGTLETETRFGSFVDILCVGRAESSGPFTRTVYLLDVQSPFNRRVVKHNIPSTVEEVVPSAERQKGAELAGQAGQSYIWIA